MEKIISEKAWKEYISTLSKINKKATDMITEYINKHGMNDRKALIDYAFAVVTKYSEASGALAATWCEQIADVEGRKYLSALVADTPEYSDVAKTINGILKTSDNTERISSAAASLVKRTAADTTLQNASHFGAEYAWIPMGDTCAYCMELASLGWQKASKKMMDGHHAEHIHPNCDCQFAIRFNNKTRYKSYDSDRYKKMFDEAEGETMDEKRNYIRRMQYQNPEVRDRINEQKRELYQQNKENEDS